MTLLTGTLDIGGEILASSGATLLLMLFLWSSLFIFSVSPGVKSNVFVIIIKLKT